MLQVLFVLYSYNLLTKLCMYNEFPIKTKFIFVFLILDSEWIEDAIYFTNMGIFLNYLYFNILI